MIVIAVSNKHKAISLPLARKPQSLGNPEQLNKSSKIKFCVLYKRVNC